MKTNPDSVSTAEDAAQTLATDLQSLEAELARHKDLYLRTAADFDNFRKRMAQENERRAAAQKESFIRELLPIIDNLERAVASGAGMNQSGTMAPEQRAMIPRRNHSRAKTVISQKARSPARQARQNRISQETTAKGRNMRP